MPGDKRVAGYGNTIPYEAAYFVPACAPPRTRSGTWRRVTVPDAVSIGKSCYDTAREADLGLSWRHVPRHACCSPEQQQRCPIFRLVPVVGHVLEPPTGPLDRLDDFGRAGNRPAEAGACGRDIEAVQEYAAAFLACPSGVVSGGIGLNFP
jgi:hypothetical protein